MGQTVHLLSERGSQAARPGPGRGALKPCAERTVPGDEEVAVTPPHPPASSDAQWQGRQGNATQGMDLSTQHRNWKDPKETAKCYKFR